jgi:hypothetical protein
LANAARIVAAFCGITILSHSRNADALTANVRRHESFRA